MNSIFSSLSILSKKMSKNDIKNVVIELFRKNPNPSDTVVHSWAEKKGYNTDDVEEVIYELATKFVNILTGGRSNEKKVSEKDFDPDQIRRGIKIELEHTPDKDVAKKIVLDHLAESSEWKKG